MNRTISTILLALAFSLQPTACSPLHAQQIYRWRAETTDPKPADFPVFQGEYITLQPTLYLYGVALSFPTNATAALYYQTNGMGAAWWTSPASITTAGVATANWVPTNDVGASSYTWFLSVTSSSATTYRAYGCLRMLSSPGYSPTAAPPPQYQWISPAELLAVSNALAAAVQIAANAAGAAQSTADAASTTGGLALAAAGAAQSTADAASITGGLALAAAGAAQSTADAASITGGLALVAAGAAQSTADAASNTGGLALAAAGAAQSTADATALALSNAVVVCAGGYRNSTYWYLDYEDVYRSFSSVVSVITNLDLITSNLVPTSTYVDKQMFVTVLRGFPDGGDVRWACDPTNVASIDQIGKVTMLDAGATVVDATISAVVGADETKSITVPLYSADSATVSVTVLDPQSARYVASTNFDAMIVGGTSQWSRSYWSVTNHATSTYTRNTNCWAAAVDLSGVVVATAGGAPYWHGTLISSQHIVMAKHAYNGVGSAKRFVGRSGTVYNTTIAAILDPWPGQSWSAEFASWDIVIGRLSAAIPTNDVAFYSILPPTYTNQFPNGLSDVPCLVYDQHARCAVADLNSPASQNAPSDPTRAQFWSMPYTGDSGRPTFLLLPDCQPILLHLFTYATSGTSLLAARTAINAALAADGVTLSEVDLSAFKEYYP
jgi:hypothetical protein